MFKELLHLILRWRERIRCFTLCRFRSTRSALVTCSTQWEQQTLVRNSIASTTGLINQYTCVTASDMLGCAPPSNVLFKSLYDWAAKSLVLSSSRLSRWLRLQVMSRVHRRGCDRWVYAAHLSTHRHLHISNHADLNASFKYISYLRIQLMLP